MTLIEVHTVAVATLGDHVDGFDAALPEILEGAADQFPSVAFAAMLLAYGDETDGSLPIRRDMATDVSRRGSVRGRNEHAIRPPPATAFNPGLIERVADLPRKMPVVVETGVVVPRAGNRAQRRNIRFFSRPDIRLALSRTRER